MHRPTEPAISIIPSSPGGTNGDDIIRGTQTNSGDLIMLAPNGGMSSIDDNITSAHGGRGSNDVGLSSNRGGLGSFSPGGGRGSIDGNIAPPHGGRGSISGAISPGGGRGSISGAISPGGGRGSLGSIQSDVLTSQVKGKTTPAKKIPFWLWVIIAKSLGIKLHDKDKPIISAILHILTFGSAAGLFVTNAWFSGYDIISVHTKSDILDGTVSIMVMSFFCGLGVYSHRLAYRLFIHPKFLNMLRLHSKTIFKVHSALVIFVILLCFVVVMNVSTIEYTYSYQTNNSDSRPDHINPFEISNDTKFNPCQLVDVTVQVCQVYWICQMVFSVFFLVWNLLVAVVLVSVARTQTISIRRFLKELEMDAMLMGRRLSSKFARIEGIHMNQFIWKDDDSIADFFVAGSLPGHSGFSTQTSRMNSRAGSFNNLHLHLDESHINTQPPQQQQQQQHQQQSSGSRFHRLEEDGDGVELAVEPRIMSNQEIMYSFWRISNTVTLASVALQRWMSSITLMITAWSAIRLVYWLSHTPSLSGVFMFILPLLLLPLLASSYSEVNYEGKKILMSIMPTDERVDMFKYLYGQPIQMTVYGNSITYGTIGTVVAGILAAFTSKIFLQEINGI